MVVEIQPQLKRALYAELSRNGRTFKDWLVTQAEQYIRDSRQQNMVVRESAIEPPEASR